MIVHRFTNYCYQLELSPDDFILITEQIGNDDITPERYIEIILKSGLTGLTVNNPENGD